MEKLPKLTFEEIEADITIIEDMDLNSLFQLTYNFDILKSTISALFQNQENLQKKINKAFEVNNEQNKYIETLHQYIKDNCVTKKEYNPQKEKLESKIKELDQKITQIDEELVKSN